jgi:MFS family permease
VKAVSQNDSGHFVSDLRTALRFRWFRRLFAVRLTGQLSDGVFQVALAAYVVFNPTQAATVGKVAGAFAMLLLPFTVVGPFAGVFLDRWRRRQVLLWANVTRAVLVIGVAGIAAAGLPDVVFDIAVLFVFGVNRFILSGLSAAVPHTVDAERLVIANSVSPTAGTIATTIGAGAGFVTHLLFGKGTLSTVVVLLAAAVLYGAAGALAGTMPRDQLGPAEVPTDGVWTAIRVVAAELRAGVRHVVDRRPAGVALAAITANRFCYGAITIMALLLYRNYFNSPDDTSAGLAGFGTMIGVSGVGFFVAALITPDVTRRIGLPRWMVICLVCSAVTECALGSPFRQVPLLIGAFLLGVFAQGQKICTDTTVQRHVDDAFRGRIFSLYDMLFNGAYVLAAVFAAIALPSTGRSFGVLFALTGIYLLTAAGFLLGRAGAPRPAAVESAEPVLDGDPAA